MKTLKVITTFFLIGLASFAIAGNKIHCKGVKLSEYEVRVQENRKLSGAQVNALPSTIKKKVTGADSVSSYTMTIFRGEAVPQTVQAVGAESDVLLMVFSLSSPENMETYLDELGPNDISSSLRVDGKTIDMSCDSL